MNKSLFFIIASLFSSLVAAQQNGMPASDTLGADDIYGNPTFVGGVANGGGTAHGVW
jgi:hypothetical protein